MPTFNPGLVSIYKNITEFNDDTKTINLNGVLVDANDEKPLDISNEDAFKDKLVYKLFFSTNTFIYVDLSNSTALLEFKKGSLDFLTGRETTHLKMMPESGMFSLPIKGTNPLRVTTWMAFSKIRFFLAGLNEDNLKNIFGVTEEEIAEFNLLKAIGAVEVGTPSGLKIAFTDDTLNKSFKRFVEEAHKNPQNP